MTIDELMKIAVEIEDIENHESDEETNNSNRSRPTNTELTIEDLENVASYSKALVERSTSQLPVSIITNGVQFRPAVNHTFAYTCDAHRTGTNSQHPQLPQRGVVTTTCQREEILGYSDGVYRVTTTYGHQVVIDKIRGDQSDDEIDDFMNNNGAYARSSPDSPFAGPSNVNVDMRTRRPLIIEPGARPANGSGMCTSSRTGHSPVKAGMTPRINGMMQPGCRTRDDRYTRPSTQSFEVEGFDLQNKAMSYPGGPDRGIKWPKTLGELGREDRIYYVSQFMRSQIFKTRLDRKLSCSAAWRNGLTSFQAWVVEHVGTMELEDVLRPLPRRQNHSKAKVNCW